MGLKQELYMKLQPVLLLDIQVYQQLSRDHEMENLNNKKMEYIIWGGIIKIKDTVGLNLWVQ